MNYSQRRQEQARRTQAAILEAAIRLCRERSFDKVSVREICREAGITTGAFYHHFRTKEELLDRGFAPLDAYMEQALAGWENRPPEERLWRILSSYAAFIQHMGWELVARYYQQRLSLPSARSMDPRRFTLQAMRSCLEDAQAQGRLRPEGSPAWMADFLFRHFRGVVIDWLLHRGEYPLLPKLEQDYRLFQRIFASE